MARPHDHSEITGDHLVEYLSVIVARRIVRDHRSGRCVGGHDRSDSARRPSAINGDLADRAKAFLPAPIHIYPAVRRLASRHQGCASGSAIGVAGVRRIDGVEIIGKRPLELVPAVDRIIPLFDGTDGIRQVFPVGNDVARCVNQVQGVMGHAIYNRLRTVRACNLVGLRSREALIVIGSEPSVETDPIGNHEDHVLGATRFSGVDRHLFGDRLA